MILRREAAEKPQLLKNMVKIIIFSMSLPIADTVYSIMQVNHILLGNNMMSKRMKYGKLASKR